VIITEKYTGFKSKKNIAKKYTEVEMIF